MWDDFTNLYSLSKTLRFELKPTETTKAFLSKNGIVEVDKKRQEAFKQVKRILDIVHRQFISESLENLELDTTELQHFIAVSIDKSVKRADVSAVSKPVFAKFASQFAATNKAWAERFSLKKPFTTSPDSQLAVASILVPSIAKQLDLSEEAVRQQLAQFAKFSTYFKGFQENRLNCYTTEGKITEVANRAISQNLLKYHKNAEKVSKYYTSIDSPFPLNDNERSYFSLENYRQHLTQPDIDKYNYAIGELNARINEARQNLGKEFKPKLPMFETLYKQILSDGTKVVRFQTLASQDEYQVLVTQLQASIPAWLAQLRTHFNDHIQTISMPDKVYLSKKAVNTILHKYVMDFSLVTSELPPELTKRTTRNDDVTDSANFVSLEQFIMAIDRAQDASNLSILKDHESVAPHASQVVWDKFTGDLNEAIICAETDNKAFVSITDYQGKSSLETIKTALDSFNDICRLYSYFELRYKNEAVTSLDADPEFYAIFEPTTDAGSPFDPDKDKRFSHAYDLIRNWLTKKPYSLDKWKLNFNVSNLLNGWASQDGSAQYNGWIIRKAKSRDIYTYFLAISQNADYYSWHKYPDYFDTDNSYEIVDYRNFKSTSFFGSSWIGMFGSKYKDCKMALPKEELANMLDVLIRKNLPRYPELSTALEIADYDERVKTVASMKVPKVSYRRVSSVLVENDEHPKNKTSSQLIFEISSKDFINKHDSKHNLHTDYLINSLTKGSTMVLDGGAEVFFRPASIIGDVNQRKLKNERLITENKRFTAEKIFFHLPIRINGLAPKLTTNKEFNQHAIERIKTNRVNAVIGIDRGEKHLAYVAVVDRKGKLITEPISLNTITSTKPDGGNITKDYFALLKEQETKRKEDRQNWAAVRKIKDLKNGYVGHCVKQIVDLAIKYNAIIVLEDLNRGFKQGRSAIERSVYNQLEQALLKKLQYVVDKSAQPDDVFGSRNGVQLAPPDVSPARTGSHMGFVFFVDPSYTSAVDPVTGYRQQFRLDERINTSNFQRFIAEGFDSIAYENSNLIFRFNWRQLADARNKIGKSYITAKEAGKISSKSWQVTANVERTIYKKQKNGVNETILVNPQVELLKLLSAADIKLDGDIKKQLATTKPTAEFVKNFIRCFNNINRLRNTINEQDAIISPVYPSGFSSMADKLDGYAWNGDANGAYNIARKGVILLDKLYAAKSPKDFKCSVSVAEYDEALTSE